MALLPLKEANQGTLYYMGWIVIIISFRYCPQDPLAGIIPRALSQLFDELRISNTEYTVRVSYLELYNEELFDLLSSSEDNSKLRIYEDVTRKGSNIVNGLEEITVCIIHFL